MNFHIANNNNNKLAHINPQNGNPKLSYVRSTCPVSSLYGSHLLIRDATLKRELLRESEKGRKDDLDH